MKLRPATKEELKAYEKYKKTANIRVVPIDRKKLAEKRKKKLAENRKKKDAYNKLLKIRRSRRF